MVKVVDNYVLQRVIGKGQFGEVYKGYHKSTLQDVAIKAVNRQKLKGKFYELLENEIKVLRTCDNINIIKLYDIKKTSNNIYLMLEYCNEGDLQNYLKKKKFLTEEEAVDILIQILNCFKTLTKNKIMHRDFKLPNILINNGIIKIADFGFSKILEGDESYAETMLGSPLNMAPEILQGIEYNNKCDIWSIGTVFYELMFEKPPYTANHIVELVKNIKQNPFKMPDNHNMSPQVVDVLEKMLQYEPSERISWEELFNHPVTKMQEEKIMKDIEITMKSQDIENISRFYIKNNKVIDHPEDIYKKKDINTYAYQACKDKNFKFQGQPINRKKIRINTVVDDQTAINKHEMDTKGKGKKISTQETEREKRIKIFKNITKRILHERNIYAFFATVAEDAISLDFQESNYIGYLLIKKLYFKLEKLKLRLENCENHYNLPLWESYCQSTEYKNIESFIMNEFELFRTYYQNLNGNLEKTKNEISNALVSIKSEDQIDQQLKEFLKTYISGIFKDEKNRADSNIYVHLNQLIDCMNSKRVFNYCEEDNFDFKQFYIKMKKQSIEDLEKSMRNKLKVESIKIDF